MIQLDILDLPFRAQSFDAFLCSHVLEHIQDDRKAMRELARVLKPSGWGVVIVPISRDRTIEDPSITDRAERLRLFGQEDHVRVYGADVVDRLKEAGFSVTQVTPAEVVSSDEAAELRIPLDCEPLFILRHSGQDQASGRSSASVQVAAR